MTRRENDSHRDGTWHRVIIFAPSENQMRRHELIQPFPLSTSKPMRNCGRRFNESRSKCSFTWYSYFVWLDASNTWNGIFLFYYRGAWCVCFVVCQLGFSQILSKSKVNLVRFKFFFIRQLGKNVHRYMYENSIALFSKQNYSSSD